MAESPAHRFGQVIGNLLESILLPPLQAFCDRRGLYLDKKGLRGQAREGKKVTWTDRFGNEHDLDFVIEKGGSADERGRPVAFIEAAWRRYTKHSRNKAQEIQGAIVPIAENHSWDAPFLGAVVAGVFTDGSLTQMKSVGFEVLYFPYETIVAAFRDVGVDVKFDEETPDDEFRKSVEAIEGLEREGVDALQGGLLKRNAAVVEAFLKKLESTLDRAIDFVAVIPLFGDEHRFHSIAEAVKYLSGNLGKPGGGFRKFEVIVRYTSSDSVQGSFATREKALDFLRYMAG